MTTHPAYKLTESKDENNLEKGKPWMMPEVKKSFDHSQDAGNADRDKGSGMHVDRQNTHPVMHPSTEVPELQMSPVSQAQDAMPTVSDAGFIQRIPIPASTGSLPGSTPAQATPSYTLPPAQTGSMLRTTFEAMLRNNFGVTRVFNGTRSDQQNILRSASGNSGLTFNDPAFREWNPGSDSEIYTHIINAFRIFSMNFGGIPPVREIGFFDLRFAWDRPTSSVVQEPNVPAAYGGHSLLVYSLIELAPKRLPTGRSTTGPAATPVPSHQVSIERFITHELGHGLVEVALTAPGTATGSSAAPDAQLLNDYQREVGWTSGSSPELYDAGVPAVRQALAAGRTPDARYRITTANWNQPGWIEQPLSAYMTSRPSEDFPEAVMTYVNEPSLLRDRSPARFRFMQQRALLLGPYLRQIAAASPQPGDFPSPAAGQALG